MEVWVIILLIFLVVLVAIMFLAVLKHNVYGKFEFPAPPELLSGEEKAFIENPELVGKLCAFISKNPFYAFANMLPDVEVTQDVFISDAIAEDNFNYLEKVAEMADETFESEKRYAIQYHLYDEISFDDLVKKIGTLQDEKDKKIGEARERIIRKGILELKDIKSGIVLIPLGVTVNGSPHMCCLIVDFDNKRIIKIDPHGQTENYVRTILYSKLISDMEYVAPELINFKYIDLRAITQKYVCPVFQGSFEENSGLCTIWSLYIAFLFIRNSEKKYDEMIHAHARNVKWTQRRLQNFAFSLYKEYKDTIDSITNFNISSITGAPMEKPKGY